MGPLQGIRVVELGGIGPAPFGGMMLADMGAEVVRVDRRQRVDLGVDRGLKGDILNRGKRSLALDLKDPRAVDCVLSLVDRADVMLEGFRPGVVERLGLGPEACHARNAALVFGRMTGWGQEGPLAAAAGHDINYIALSGALNAIGEAGRGPVPPLNLVGDFGGGGMLLAAGVLAALVEAGRSGKGQVVDAAIVDGAALLMASVYGLHGVGKWQPERGSNILDGGAHFYGVYETADGKWISIGPIEQKFQQQLAELLGLGPEFVSAQFDREQWDEKRKVLAEVFLSQDQDHWIALLEGSEVCFAPVLDMEEAPRHPHAQARQAFVNVDGVVHPAPAPRFARTPGHIRGPAPDIGQDTAEVLKDWGFDTDEIETLIASGVAGPEEGRDV